jgi:hypothetical protein
MFNSKIIRFDFKILNRARNASSKSSNKNVPVFQYAKDNNKRSVDRVYVSQLFKSRCLTSSTLSRISVGDMLVLALWVKNNF